MRSGHSGVVDVVNEPGRVVVIKEITTMKPDHDTDFLYSDACYRKSCRMVLKL